MLRSSHAKRTEIIKAFVVLGSGWPPTEELAKELRRFVRDRLTAHACPRAFLSDRRNAKAAKRFLAKTLRRRRDWKPRVINTDKNPSFFCNLLSLVNPFLSFDPVAGALLLSGVGAQGKTVGPPPDGVG